MECHQYALDAQNQWVNATRIPFNQMVTYFCECPERHKLKHVKPSGRANKRQFTAYFAHITNGKRKRDTILCGKGGESLQHRHAKHRLREYVNCLSFATTRCKRCRGEDVFSCQGCSIRLELRSDDGLWRYDCVLFDSSGAKRFALEVVYTHFTGQAKADSTRQAGLGIAEFTVADVMGLGPLPKKLDNILVVTWECAACQKRDLEVARTNELALEAEAWLFLELQMWEALEEQWTSHTFLKSLLQTRSNMEKAIAILDHFQNVLWLSTHRWGDISLGGNLKKCPRGLGMVVNSEHTFIPAHEVFLLVIDQSSVSNPHEIRQKMRAVWQIHSICDNLVFGVTCENILYRLEVLQSGGDVTLNNQLFAILKKNEADHQICAQCGTYGHKSEACQRKFCTKCGRGGHLARVCFAKKSVVHQIHEQN